MLANLTKGFVPLAFAASLAIASPAFGATKGAGGKKMTLEQAWAFCKAQLDKRFSWEQTSARYAAGGSCMKRFGYRL